MPDRWLARSPWALSSSMDSDYLVREKEKTEFSFPNVERLGFLHSVKPSFCGRGLNLISCLLILLIIFFGQLPGSSSIVARAAPIWDTGTAPSTAYASSESRAPKAKSPRFSREFLVILQDGSYHAITADGEIRWSSHPPQELPTTTQVQSTRRLLPGPDGKIIYRGDDGSLVVSLISLNEEHLFFQPLPINVRDIVFHSPFSTPLFPDVYFLGKRETLVERLDFYTVS